ncbi:MAG: hypothetical protein ACXAC7_10665 [Candidatus Hodarchaeales archaeon]
MTNTSSEKKIIRFGTISKIADSKFIVGAIASGTFLFFFVLWLWGNIASAKWIGPGHLENLPAGELFIVFLILFFIPPILFLLVWIYSAYVIHRIAMYIEDQQYKKKMKNKKQKITEKINS